MGRIVVKKPKRHGVVNSIEWIVKDDNTVKLSLRYEIPDLWFTINCKTEEDVKETIEKMIEETKDSYYEALEKSSIGWHDNKNDYSYFVWY